MGDDTLVPSIDVPALYARLGELAKRPTTDRAIAQELQRAVGSIASMLRLIDETTQPDAWADDRKLAFMFRQWREFVDAELPEIAGLHENEDE